MKYSALYMDRRNELGEKPGHHLYDVDLDNVSLYYYFALNTLDN